MSDVDPRQDKINDFEVADNRPTSESLLHKITGDINYLIDETNDQASVISNISARQAVQGAIGPASLFLSNFGDGFRQEATVTITPTQSNVAIFYTGYYNSQLMTVQLLNGGTLVRQQNAYTNTPSVSPMPFSFFNYFDTNATPGIANVYSLFVRGGGFAGFGGTGFRIGMCAVEVG